MAIALDYTQVDISDDGATFGTAIRTQFQNAQSDLGNRPEKAGAETITGDWLFGLGDVTFGNGFESTGLADFSFGQVDIRTPMYFKNNGVMRFNNNPTHDGNCSFGGEIAFEGGVNLHAPGTSGDVTVAEITMEEVASGNTSPNGMKIVKEDGGEKITIAFYKDGTLLADTGISLNTKNGNIVTGSSTYLNVGKLIVRATPPANSSSSGITNEIAVDSNYIYVCVANNTWKRVALSTW